MKRWFEVALEVAWIALCLWGCSSALSDPCSPESVSAKATAIVTECKLRREAECKGYDVIDECPLIQECDERIEKVDSGC